MQWRKHKLMKTSGTTHLPRACSPWGIIGEIKHFNTHARVRYWQRPSWDGQTGTRDGRMRDCLMNVKCVRAHTHTHGHRDTCAGQISWSPAESDGLRRTTPQSHELRSLSSTLALMYKPSFPANLILLCLKPMEITPIRGVTEAASTRARALVKETVSFLSLNTYIALLFVFVRVSRVLWAEMVEMCVCVFHLIALRLKKPKKWRLFITAYRCFTWLRRHMCGACLHTAYDWITHRYFIYLHI